MAKKSYTNRLEEIIVEQMRGHIKKMFPKYTSDAHFIENAIVEKIERENGVDSTQTKN